MTPAKLLFDSNAFFACVNISRHGIHADAELGTRLMELANKTGCEVWLTAATQDDINRSADPAKRLASSMQMRQWKNLEPLSVPLALVTRAEYSPPLSPNDEVDTHMLAALEVDAADFLITQDKKLRRHAARAGFADRVMTLQGSIELLEQLAGKPQRHPTVSQVKAYTLNAADPIFDSLRTEYGDAFDPWLAKARSEHRDCFTINGIGDGLDALAILKDEHDRPHGLAGHVLKICTFKVAVHAEGAKRGELLLKAVLEYAAQRDHDKVYVEVFDTHDGIVRLLEQFGFAQHPGTTERGELVLVKSRRPGLDTAALNPLEFHRRYGPPAVLAADVFLVPIQPRWHSVLFPELREQHELFAPAASGNALIKAYLTKSTIRSVSPGSLLLFYRSETAQGVTAVGVVDDLLRSSDPAEIRRFVGQRTVYSDDDITRQCSGGPVLAMRFRHDRVLDPAWARQSLINAGVMKAAPQSLQQVTQEEGLTWLRERLNARR